MTSYLTSGPEGTMRGNCTLILKRHLVELYDLECLSLISIARSSGDALRSPERLRPLMPSIDRGVEPPLEPSNSRVPWWACCGGGL